MLTNDQSAYSHRLVGYPRNSLLTYYCMFVCCKESAHPLETNSQQSNHQRQTKWPKVQVSCLNLNKCKKVLFLLNCISFSSHQTEISRFGHEILLCKADDYELIKVCNFKMNFNQKVTLKYVLK